MILINICKPFGIYSRNLYKCLSQICKVGHCGTLDKNAKGVMIIVTNKSTKLSNLISNFSKKYFFTILFDYDTFTNDLYGSIENFGVSNISNCVLKQMYDYIIGFKHKCFKQKCPRISSKKVNGKAMYKYFFNHFYKYKKNKFDYNFKFFNYVFIYDVKICFINKYFIDVYLHVSSGFYVRSFVRDFAKYFNIFACVYNIHRVSIGCFSIVDSLLQE